MLPAHTILTGQAAEAYARNWCQVYQYSAGTVLRPNTVHDVQTIVKSKEFDSVKVLGTKHCFNGMADTPKQGRTAHLTLERLDQVWIGEDERGPIAKFGAGVTYTILMKAIVAHGAYACENLPSLPHINIVGSMLTATHGSGHKYCVLADKVLEMDVVLADGKLVTLRKGEDPDFEHFLMSWGVLGIVTCMTMSLVPRFNVMKGLYNDLKWDVLFNTQTFNEVMRKQDFLSFFISWKDRHMDSVWVGRKYMPNEKQPPFVDNYYGAPHIKTEKQHPIRDYDPDACIFPGPGP